MTGAIPAELFEAQWVATGERGRRGKHRL